MKTFIKSIIMKYSLATITLLMSLSLGCADLDGDLNQDSGVSKSALDQDFVTGESCGSGCEWSALATSLGQLPQGASCGGVACACVQSSDIWSLCAVEPQAETLQDETQGTSSQNPWFQDDEIQQDQQDPWTDQQTSTDEPSQITQVSNGQSCGNGCIWSAIAVSTGAQSEEARCESGGCACVEIGDIWSSCSGAQGYQDQWNQPSTEPSTEPNPAEQTSPSVPQGSYNAQIGNRLADLAYQIAISRNTTGRCYSAVADAIETITGPFLWGNSAYMAADQLAANASFTEVSVASYDLVNLPAGAVVVWGRGSSEHGHISIALGDGREASDHVTQQHTSHYGGAGARVFYPR